jgi:hypothetical protein
MRVMLVILVIPSWPSQLRSISSRRSGITAVPITTVVSTTRPRHSRKATCWYLRQQTQNPRQIPARVLAHKPLRRQQPIPQLSPRRLLIQSLSIHPSPAKVLCQIRRQRQLLLYRIRQSRATTLCPIHLLRLRYNQTSQSRATTLCPIHLLRLRYSQILLVQLARYLTYRTLRPRRLHNQTQSLNPILHSRALQLQS